jgi:hypothetical protein
MRFAKAIECWDPPDFASFTYIEFRRMCGPKFCSMHHSRTIEEGIAQLAAELDAEQAAKAGVEEKGELATV